jgi:hypothetical protein
MKKKLEADLISIAHRILKLKNKSDINQLYLETQKLYEKLAVLKFVEENFETAKPTIGQADIKAEVESILDKQEELLAETEIRVPDIEEETSIEAEATPEIDEKEITETVAEENSEVQPETEAVDTTVIPVEPEEITKEPVAEITREVTEEPVLRTVDKEKPILDFTPAFELEAEKEETKKEQAPQPNIGQILFEDLGINYRDTQFVKVDSFEPVVPSTPSINEFKEVKEPVDTVVAEPAKAKTVPLNEKLAKGFHIDLNDRIAFTKNLFGNNTEDYSRVLNQLLTFDIFSEAKDFIETMVKPDYNDWQGKEDYEERFLGIIEKRFS